MFPVLHGPYGEDGTVQGLLELANVPYVGAGVLASAVGMDKAAMKLVFAASGLPICDYEVVLKRDWQRDERGIMKTIVDQARLPGLREAGESRIERRHLEGEARDRAARGDAPGRRVRSQDRDRGGGARRARDRVRGARQRRARGVGAGRGRPVARVLRLRGQIHRRRSSQAADSGAADGGASASEVRTLAIAAYKAVDCAGMARVDFLLARDSGVLYLNEVNTIPGFTTISMYSKMWDGQRRRRTRRCSIDSSRSRIERHTRQAAASDEHVTSQVDCRTRSTGD